MLYEIVNDFPHEILNAKNPPFISLYQPTHRYSPENKQDAIRFKNLIREVEDSLMRKHPKREIVNIMKPFYAIAKEKMFWNYTLDGLAVLATEDRCIVYNLPRPVKEVVVVADTFYIKPLIRIFQSADRYHLLGLNRKEFKIYEGNRYGFKEVKIPPDIPTTIEEALGETYGRKEPSLSARTVSSMGSGVFYGQGSKKDIIDSETEKFFRYVDKVVWENYSRPTGLPLMLIALKEHHTFFKKISRNPFLMKEGIETAFNSLTVSELKDAAWEKMEPIYLGKTKKLIDAYELARSKFLATDDLAQIARAALSNNVGTLLVEADRIIPGKINRETSELIEGDLKDVEVGDILDDLAEMVFKNKGEVVVLPKERMPTDTGAAAIFRY